MNKRNNSGGGQSSLGYLFGSDELGQQPKDQSKVSLPPVCMPPYGVDNVEANSPEKASTPPSKKDDSTSLEKFIYHGDYKSKGFLVTVSVFYTFLKHQEKFLYQKLVSS